MRLGHVNLANWALGFGRQEESMIQEVAGLVAL
jgi:hypothetical protein